MHDSPLSFATNHELILVHARALIYVPHRVGYHWTLIGCIERTKPLSDSLLQLIYLIYI